LSPFFCAPLKFHLLSITSAEDFHGEKNRQAYEVRVEYNKKRHFGGYYKNMMDAAQKVNEICDKIGIPHKNFHQTKMVFHHFLKGILEFHGTKAVKSIKHK